MAFRKGKNKNLKQRLPIFDPFTYFRRRRAITAEELLQLRSYQLHLHLQVCSALSSSSSLHFISLQPLHLSPLHLIRLRPRSSDYCGRSSPTAISSASSSSSGMFGAFLFFISSFHLSSTSSSLPPSSHQTAPPFCLSDCPENPPPPPTTTTTQLSLSSSLPSFISSDYAMLCFFYFFFYFKLKFGCWETYLIHLPPSFCSTFYL